MKKKMVSLSHNNVLTGDFFSFIKCKSVFILLWCLLWDLYSKLATEWNDWNRDIWVLGLSCGSICFVLYMQKSERVSLFIKNSVQVLLPAGEVRGKERSQTRRGVCRVWRWGRCFIHWVRRGGGFSTLGAMQSCPWAWLQWHHSQWLKDQRKMLLSASQTLQTKREVKCFSCALFASHLGGTRQNRQSVRLWRGKKYREWCVRSQEAWIWFKTSYSKVYFNRYKILQYHP